MLNPKGWDLIPLISERVQVPWDLRGTKPERFKFLSLKVSPNKKEMNLNHQISSSIPFWLTKQLLKGLFVKFNIPTSLIKNTKNPIIISLKRNFDSQSSLCMCTPSNLANGLCVQPKVLFISTLKIVPLFF